MRKKAKEEPVENEHDSKASPKDQKKDREGVLKAGHDQKLLLLARRLRKAANKEGGRRGGKRAPKENRAADDSPHSSIDDLLDSESSEDEKRSNSSGSSSSSLSGRESILDLYEWDYDGGENDLYALPTTVLDKDKPSAAHDMAMILIDEWRKKVRTRTDRPDKEKLIKSHALNEFEQKTVVQHFLSKDPSKRRPEVLAGLALYFKDRLGFKEMHMGQINHAVAKGRIERYPGGSVVPTPMQHHVHILAGALGRYKGHHSTDNELLQMNEEVEEIEFPAKLACDNRVNGTRQKYRPQHVAKQGDVIIKTASLAASQNQDRRNDAPEEFGGARLYWDPPKGYWLAMEPTTIFVFPAPPPSKKNKVNRFRQLIQSKNERVTFTRGDYILKRGEEGVVFLIESGVVAVQDDVATDECPNPPVLDRLNPKEWFGHVAAHKDEASDWTFVAASKQVVCRLYDSETFLERVAFTWTDEYWEGEEEREKKWEETWQKFAADQTDIFMKRRYALEGMSKEQKAVIKAKMKRLRGARSAKIRHAELMREAAKALQDGKEAKELLHLLADQNQDIPDEERYEIPPECAARCCVDLSKFHSIRRRAPPQPRYRQVPKWVAPVCPVPGIMDTETHQVLMEDVKKLSVRPIKGVRKPQWHHNTSQKTQTSDSSRGDMGSLEQFMRTVGDDRMPQPWVPMAELLKKTKQVSKSTDSAPSKSGNSQMEPPEEPGSRPAAADESCPEPPLDGSKPEERSRSGEAMERQSPEAGEATSPNVSADRLEEKSGDAQEKSITMTPGGAPSRLVSGDSSTQRRSYADMEEAQGSKAEEEELDPAAVDFDDFHDIWVPDFQFLRQASFDRLWSGKSGKSEISRASVGQRQEGSKLGGHLAALLQQVDQFFHADSSPNLDGHTDSSEEDDSGEGSESEEQDIFGRIFLPGYEFYEELDEEHHEEPEPEHEEVEYGIGEYGRRGSTRKAATPGRPQPGKKKRAKWVKLNQYAGGLDIAEFIINDIVALKQNEERERVEQMMHHRERMVAQMKKQGGKMGVSSALRIVPDEVKALPQFDRTTRWKMPEAPPSRPGSGVRGRTSRPASACRQSGGPPRPTSAAARRSSVGQQRPQQAQSAFRNVGRMRPSSGARAGRQGIATEVQRQLSPPEPPPEPEEETVPIDGRATPVNAAVRGVEPAVPVVPMWCPEMATMFQDRLQGEANAASGAQAEGETDKDAAPCSSAQAARPEAEEDEAEWPCSRPADRRGVQGVRHACQSARLLQSDDDLPEDGVEAGGEANDDALPDPLVLASQTEAQQNQSQDSRLRLGADCAADEPPADAFDGGATTLEDTAHDERDLRHQQWSDLPVAPGENTAAVLSEPPPSTDIIAERATAGGQGMAAPVKAPPGSRAATLEAIHAAEVLALAAEDLAEQLSLAEEASLAKLSDKLGSIMLSKDSGSAGGKEAPTHVAAGKELPRQAPPDGLRRRPLSTTTAPTPTAAGLGGSTRSTELLRGASASAVRYGAPPEVRQQVARMMATEVPALTHPAVRARPRRPLSAVAAAGAARSGQKPRPGAGQKLPPAIHLVPAGSSSAAAAKASSTAAAAAGSGRPSSRPVSACSRSLGGFRLDEHRHLRQRLEALSAEPTRPTSAHRRATPTALLN
eukprot:TRINITY_DN11939_c0_g3_i1.p1 TRINITY_DN11939_c0_g3~~TRINITY_DN11939_c0_g3_i1.p1  ORF type:complete len:1640 (+),score=399.47 TRINITY_DN11939_c0_g3_i1:192-5111(+)